MKVVRQLTPRQLESLMANRVAFTLLPSGEAEIEVADQPEKESTMITPTIGRVVWFWPSTSTTGQPVPALVAYVHSDRMVNLGGFDANGVAFAATSVPLIQDGDVRPAAYFAEWMPYQKGQAAKTEALEKQVAGA